MRRRFFGASKYPSLFLVHSILTRYSQSDLPYSPQHIELLLDCYEISHLLTVRPSESTAKDLTNATCLHIAMDDDFQKDDLVLHVDRMIDFIKSGLTKGTGVLIHSLELMHIRLAFAAYGAYLSVFHSVLVLIWC
jgi:hypothetical protein